jgi:uncharacterized protein
MSRGNPCVQCGACCAFFRVSFFWEESNPDNPAVVPNEYTEEIDGWFQCMKGTNQRLPYCIALRGKIGSQVSCAIYNRRSSSCHEFGIQENGGVITVNNIDLNRCNQARKGWNLPPLTRSDLSSRAKYPAIRQIPPHSHMHIKNHHSHIF